MTLTNSAANKVQRCPDTRTHSKPTTLTVKTLNIAIEEGIFAGKDPNHEPSRNCLFCGYIAMVNIDLINFQEGKKNDQTTHPPFSETLSEQTVLIPKAELNGSV